MILAEHIGGEGHMFGWFFGIGLAFAIIVVVVVVVASILTLARRIEVQAQMATDALDACRANSLPLWDVSKADDSARAVLDGLQTARAALEG